MALHFGITEHGDAALDYRWVKAVTDAAAGKRKLDGAVIITKNLTERFRKELPDAYHVFPYLILHATCTGWGGSVMEPNVPDFRTQITALASLIRAGFPSGNCVLRLDPVIPSDPGIEAAKRVLDYAVYAGLFSGTSPVRLRFSVYDEYPHVRRRLMNAGYADFYDGSFHAPAYLMRAVRTRLLDAYPQLVFEACAEPSLSAPNLVHAGCVSARDLAVLGIEGEDDHGNPQNRRGCLCMTGKTELLDRSRKHPCAHSCLYCFWKRDGE